MKRKIQRMAPKLHWLGVGTGRSCAAWNTEQTMVYRVLIRTKLGGGDTLEIAAKNVNEHDTSSWTTITALATTELIKPNKLSPFLETVRTSTTAGRIVAFFSSILRRAFVFSEISSRECIYSCLNPI